MRLFNICTRREYEKDGEKRSKYYKAGELQIDESTGRMFMRLFHNPGIKYYFFDTEEKLPTVDANTNEELKE